MEDVFSFVLFFSLERNVPPTPRGLRFLHSSHWRAVNIFHSIILLSAGKKLILARRSHGTNLSIFDTTLVFNSHFLYIFIACIQFEGFINNTVFILGKRCFNSDFFTLNHVLIKQKDTCVM